MASDLCLVMGGVRSGKSAFAEGLTRELSVSTLYVATGLPSDPEMEERIRRHRQKRPPDWTTLEEPLDLAARIETVMQSPEPPAVVLVDSLDVWLANMLLKSGDRPADEVEAEVLAAADGLLDVAGCARARFIIVSSEVGLSLVPPEPLGRRFQDLLGTVNQRVAAASSAVYLVVAGVPTAIKGPLLDERAHDG